MQLSPKQTKSLIESQQPINIWEGSVRSGKTYVSLWRYLQDVAEGPLGEYVVITITFDAFKRNLLPQLNRMVGDVLQWFPGKREIHLYDKIIHVIGCSDERSEGKIRGPTFRGAYVDELSIIPESAFKMLVSRCAMGGAKIFATTNPDSPFHWVKTDFLTDNPDVASWQFKLDDNPELKESEKDYLKRQYQGLWYKRFILGEWALAEGAVYDFFSEKDHVIDNPPTYAKYFIAGVDYGTTNPFACVLLGFNDDVQPSIWVQDEYYYDSKKKQKQLTDFEYAEDVKRFLELYCPKVIYVDPSAASFQLELRKRGFTVKQADNDVENGIRSVSKFLSGGDLKICKKAKNLIDEFYSYVWDQKATERGIEKPKKQHDHCLDAVRYACYTHWGLKRTIKETTAEEKELDMYRRMNQSKNPMDPTAWGHGWQRFQG